MAVPAALPLESLRRLLISLSAAGDLSGGQQLHALLLKSGHSPSSSSLSSPLITLYSRCSLPFLSLRAFLDLPSSPSPSPSSWSALLSSLSRNSLPSLALLSFRRMLASGLPPCPRTLPSAAKSFAALSDPSSSSSRALHSLAIKSSLSPHNVFASSSLLHMYARCGRLPDALQLFLEIPHPNVVSSSTLIHAYSLSPSLLPQAFLLFRASLLPNGCGVNDFTLSSLIRACASSTLLDLGSQTHSRCIKTSLDSSPFVATSLISLYSKCGIVDLAYRLFDETPHQNRNLGAWNAVLMASAQHGHSALAFSRFREMRRLCPDPPNSITFLCLLTVCSHAGLVSEGRRYFFDIMPTLGVERKSEHYAAMVDMLGRAGEIKEALAAVESMPIPPTESVWGALLTGCRLHGDTETAAYAAEKVLELGCEGSGAHMLLVNAYAAAGRYAEAGRARKAMRDRGVRKETGMSWLELERGRVHSFVSGDRSHPRMEEIYGVLEEVGMRMEAMGYVAETSGVGRDVDGEEKRRSVGCHSERLAIGLGLLAVAPPRTIRVMKNLLAVGCWR